MLEQTMDAQRGWIGEVLAAAIHRTREGIRLVVQLQMIIEVLVHLVTKMALNGVTTELNSRTERAQFES